MPTKRNRRSPISWLAVILCWLYLLPAAGYLALRGTHVPLPYLINSLGYLGLWLFVPLVLVLPLAGLVRARVTLLGGLALLVYAAVLYVPFFVRPAPAPCTAATFTVLNYNVWAGIPPDAHIVEAIRAQGADIVALEELSPATTRAIDSALGNLYPYRVLDANGMQIGLLSRFPIVAHDGFRPAGTGRVGIRATLDVAGTPVQVFVVHPFPPGIGRLGSTLVPTGVNDKDLLAEIEDVAQRAAAVQGSVLVIGDLNMVDLSRPYTRMAGVLRDSYREAGVGLGFSFPAGVRIQGFPLPGPFLRIDYVFRSAGLRTLQARVTPGGGSDHASLWVRFAVE